MGMKIFNRSKKKYASIKNIKRQACKLKRFAIKRRAHYQMCLCESLTESNEYWKAKTDSFANPTWETP